MDINDIFEMNKVGIIPEDILPKINAQKKVIVENPRPVNTYDLVDHGDRIVPLQTVRVTTPSLSIPFREKSTGLELTLFLWSTRTVWIPRRL